MSNDRFNEYCETLLVRYNCRNSQTVASRLENLCRFLRQEGNHVVQTMFGGSVRRGTYVTGLSDVDVLLIVNESSLVNQRPSEVIADVQDTIQRRLQNNSVTAGDLAVTVGYSDGTEIQILPAIRTNTRGVRIAEPGSTRWSRVAHPERFAEILREVNEVRDGRVVPTIKLAKAIADCFIRHPSRKITGYHMESLAVEAFSDYEGPPRPEEHAHSPIREFNRGSHESDNRFHRAVHECGRVSWASELHASKTGFDILRTDACQCQVMQY